jgi:hypothetical protein
MKTNEMWSRCPAFALMLEDLLEYYRKSDGAIKKEAPWLQL